jgi:exonuclease III
MFMAAEHNCVLLNWNVHGLNNPVRQQVVRGMVVDHHCRIVCLQETKLQVIDAAAVANILGQRFLN